MDNVIKFLTSIFNREKILAYLRKSGPWDALFIFFLICTHSSVLASYVVPTGSMMPTIQPKDRFFVFKLPYRLKLPFTKTTIMKWGAPDRGDIIAFKNPENEEIDFTKRVIGVPGDKLEQVNNVLYINDQPVKRAHIKFQDGHDFYQESFEGIKYIVRERRSPFGGISFPSITVPPNSYFVMGDHRTNSHDSRFWSKTHFVPEENIEGKLVFRWLAWVKSPFQTVWQRFGAVD